MELDNLSKWYGEVIGLNRVTASIGKGITGLLGPNGAGKSTLMGLATGQLRPSQGSIRLFGERPWDNPRVLARIGFCPEGDRFWPNQTGLEFVMFLAQASGLSFAVSRKAALEAIDAVDMTAHMKRPIKGYSKGMRQRIKVAQALAHNPDLLILDEPFTGTDPVARHTLHELLQALAAEGVDILISSHVLHEIEELTRQILFLDHGRIVAQGDLQQVRRQLRDRPHAIRVRLDEVRRLAAYLAGVPEVAGLRMPLPDTLLIETAAPDVVHEALSDWFLREEHAPREIAAADESLEAVFGYLTRRGSEEDLR